MADPSTPLSRIAELRQKAEAARYQNWLTPLVTPAQLLWLLTLAEQGVAAGEDTARLDWLQSGGEVNGPTTDYNCGHAWYWDIAQGPLLREFIDAARLPLSESST